MSKRDASGKPIDARTRADAALAEMGLMLVEWQPTRCGLLGCSWGAASHEMNNLVPAHEYQPIPDGPPLLRLAELAEIREGQK